MTDSKLLPILNLDVSLLNILGQSTMSDEKYQRSPYVKNQVTPFSGLLAAAAKKRSLGRSLMRQQEASPPKK